MSSLELINKKILVIENKVINYINKNKVYFLGAIVTFLAIILRVYFISFKSEDYVLFLEKWFNELKAFGGLNGIKKYIGDYNAPYVTILALLTYLPFSPLVSIKIVSIIFDFFTAIIVSLFVKNVFKDNKNCGIYVFLTYTIILFLPTILLNGALWAQCDIIYTAFIILSLVFLIKEKYLKAFIFFGISFAFKLQSIFVLPLYVLIYINKRKFPLYYFGIIPITNLILCIPSFLFGKSLKSCIEVYINQTNSYTDFLSLNIPNFYNLICSTSSNNSVYKIIDFPADKLGIIIVFLIFVLSAYIVLSKNVDFDTELIIKTALWSTMVCVFFLPHMHDRYLFMADVLSVIYFIIVRKKIYIPIVINFISLSTYVKYLFNVTLFSYQVIALAFCIVVIYLTYIIFKDFLKENNIYK